MYLLDTDTLSHLYAGSASVLRNLRETQDPDIRITLITKIETLRGRMDYVLLAETMVKLLEAQQRLLATERFLSQIPVVCFDQASAQQFDQLRQVGKLRKVGRADLLIASIAIASCATLVTRNLRHFRQFPSLTVVNWVD
jgi:tRNA(fMet)-specific endonuclease VapC